MTNEQVPIAEQIESVRVAADYIERYVRPANDAGLSVSASIVAALRAAIATLQERERAMAALRERINIRMNNHLVEMEPNYDDSITGFNEAWSIVLTALDDAANTAGDAGL